jgi:hypothetical protein
MKTFTPSELLAQMSAFEAACLETLDHRPLRSESPFSDMENAYAVRFDSLRFAGWLMRAGTPVPTRPPGEPQNGVDLLNHCRNFERYLVAEKLHLDSVTSMLTGLPVSQSSHRLEMLRDSIHTAEEGMKL